jgi:hypothetical protein
MPDSTVSTETLFLRLFCLIDDLYRLVAPDSVRHRPGAERMKMSDSEIITLSVMQEGKSNDSELSFHRLVLKDYHHLFPDLVSRSRYHRRRKDLMGVQREMLRELMRQARFAAAWLIIDSAPITVAESGRWKSAQMSIWCAEAGYAPSKRQFFLGFRLHALVNEAGALCDFVLAPANTGERYVAEHLLGVEAAWEAEADVQRAVLADNGYCGDWLAGLFGKHGGMLWFALRRSKRPGSPEEAALRAEQRGLRARVESVFSVLDDVFKVEETRACSAWGVMTRVVAKLLAYAVGMAVNEQLGRRATALKSLYQ